MVYLSQLRGRGQAFFIKNKWPRLDSLPILSTPGLIFLGEVKKVKIIVEYEKTETGKIRATIRVSHCGDYLRCGIFNSGNIYLDDDTSNESSMPKVGAPGEIEAVVEKVIEEVREKLSVWRAVSVPSKKEYQI